MESLATYTCDNCRTRKIACSRVLPQCQRCQFESVTCNYSRSGVIRRTRKRKNVASITTQNARHTPDESHVGDPARVTSSLPRSHLTNDIEVTRERLKGADISKQGPLSALSSLSEACAAAWHDASEFEDAGNGFFLFEDRTAVWVDSFVAALDKGRPLLGPAPPEVLHHLRTCRPHRVRERAWLVMYYSIILSIVSSTGPTDEITKKKLRCNLWLALNDVRLFLEPSEANIVALTLLACTVEEFTTQSLSWMLAANACIMLQALGVNHGRLDAETRERRVMLFWHLNLLDKALAVIFGRPPTLHTAMAREIGLPTLDQILNNRSQTPARGAPGLFRAHHFYQRLLLTRIMGDVWQCLYGNPGADDHTIAKVVEGLNSWYNQAREILEAAALTEKPFLDERGAWSIDFGLHGLSFTYQYLLVLLTRSSPQMRMQCIEASKRMLHLLEHLPIDSEEPYIGIVWHLLCSPFTPFLELFGEIVSSGATQPESKQDILHAMEQLPTFLGRRSPRNSLAAKLERIAVVFVQHAKSVVYPQGTNDDKVTSPVIMSSVVSLESWPPAGVTLQWDAFFNHAMTPVASSEPEMVNSNLQSMNLETWTSEFFGDPMFDWMGWDTQA